MASTLNVQLTDQLRAFVDRRASDKDLYATPSEYIRDLIRRDMTTSKHLYEQDLADHLVSALKSPVENHPKDFLKKERARLGKLSPKRKRAVRS